MSEDIKLEAEIVNDKRNQGPFIITGAAGLICLILVLKWFAIPVWFNEFELTDTKPDFKFYGISLIIGGFIILLLTLQTDYFLNRRYFKRGLVKSYLIAPTKFIFLLTGALTFLFCALVIIWLLFSFFYSGSYLNNASKSIRYRSSASIYLDYKNRIKSNESFAVKAKLKVTLDEYVSRSAKQNKTSVPVNTDKPTQLYGSLRLQPGSFEITDSAGEWEKKQLKIIKVKKSDASPYEIEHVEAEADWIWNLSPKNDKYGEQMIIIESKVFDSQNKEINTMVPVIRNIYVANPLGMPAWLAYLLPFLCVILSIPLIAWIFEQIVQWLRNRRAGVS